MDASVNPEGVLHSIPIMSTSVEVTVVPENTTAAVNETTITQIDDSSDDDRTLYFIIGGASAFVILVVVLIICCCRRCCKGPRSEPPELPDPFSIGGSTAPKPQPPAKSTHSLLILGDAPPPPTSNNHYNCSNSSISSNNNSKDDGDEESSGVMAGRNFGALIPCNPPSYRHMSVDSDIDSVSTLPNGTAVFHHKPGPPFGASATMPGNNSSTANKPGRDRYANPSVSSSQSMGPSDRPRRALVPPCRSENNVSKVETLRKISEGNQEHWWTLSRPVIHGIQAPIDQSGESDDNDDDDESNPGYFRMDKQSPKNRFSLSPPAPLSNPPTPCGKGKAGSGYVNDNVLPTDNIYQNGETIEDTPGGMDVYENFRGRARSRTEEPGLPTPQHQGSLKYANASAVDKTQAKIPSAFEQETEGGFYDTLPTASGFDPPNITAFEEDDNGVYGNINEGFDANEENIYGNVIEDTGKTSPQTVKSPADPPAAAPIPIYGNVIEDSSKTSLQTVKFPATAPKPILSQAHINRSHPNVGTPFVAKPPRVEPKPTSPNALTKPTSPIGLTKPTPPNTLTKPISPIALTKTSTASDPGMSAAGKKISNSSYSSSRFASDTSSDTVEYDEGGENVYEKAISPFSAVDEESQLVYVNLGESPPTTDNRYGPRQAQVDLTVRQTPTLGRRGSNDSTLNDHLARNDDLTSELAAKLKARLKKSS